MTAYLTFKALESGKLQPEQMLKVSEKAWKAEGSRMFLEIKKPVSVSDLIKGLIVQSGNDAAITLAEALGGSEEEFAKQMNAEAKRLGMMHTHFENSTGLPGKSHLTTVQDLMTLTAAIIRDYPQYYPIYGIKNLYLQQHYPAQPQSAALPRPQCGRFENRAYRQRRLQPDCFQQTQRAQGGIGGGGYVQRRSTRHRKQQTAELCPAKL